MQSWMFSLMAAVGWSRPSPGRLFIRRDWSKVSPPYRRLPAIGMPVIAASRRIMACAGLARVVAAHTFEKCLIFFFRAPQDAVVTLPLFKRRCPNVARTGISTAEAIALLPVSDPDRSGSRGYALKTHRSPGKPMKTRPQKFCASCVADGATSRRRGYRKFFSTGILASA